MRPQEIPYSPDTDLSDLRPFTMGGIDEVEQGMTRIYDRNGWPIVEVWGKEELARAIVSMLNE
jgi:hypothetical protein